MNVGASLITPVSNVGQTTGQFFVNVTHIKPSPPNRALLQSQRQLTSPFGPLENKAGKIISPIKVDRLAAWLEGYDVFRTQFLLEGFSHGFRVGYSGIPECKIYPNHKSALENPEVIDAYLESEIREGRMVGPLSNPPDKFHCSPLALVPKKKPGAFRVIHNLSYPSGKSINDFIPDYCTQVHYQSVYDAIFMLCELGHGSFMCKSDIEKAFRLIPIHEKDQHLFLVNWKGQYYLDLRLEMGCSSACQIFEEFSSAVAWITHHHLHIPNVHYLDDFLLGSETKTEGNENLARFLYMCRDIGIPIALDKTFAPHTTMSFLGFEIDTIAQEIRLPIEKVMQCKTEILNLIERRKVRLRKLQSVIGLLNFACEVILPGRAFLRRLISLTCGISNPYHWIVLNRSELGIKDDLRVWLDFLDEFNGKTFFLSSQIFSNSDLKLFTDSSLLGYGGHFFHPLANCTEWFFGAWSSWWQEQNIMILELYPIVIALECWGPVLENKRLLILTDNQALVSVINKQTSKNLTVMILIRRLVRSCLKHNVLVLADHLSGVQNFLSDALSRLQVSRFLSQCPTAAAEPIRIPELPPSLN